MSSVCGSNSSDTFLAIVAFAANHHAVVNQQGQASAVAAAIKPLLTAQGLPDGSTADRFALYLTPDGSAHGQIIVAYEHQYLAYQIQQTLAGHPDPSRVLLYPNWGVLTQPEFIAFTPKAAELGRLLASDSALQRRAVQLGFRLVDPSVPSSTQLSGYLRQIAMPPPVDDGTRTGSTLPDLPLLEKMIDIVGDCS
jgi:hypothetical protein